MGSNDSNDMDKTFRKGRPKNMYEINRKRKDRKQPNKEVVQRWTEGRQAY